MTKEEIYVSLTTLFQDIFDDDELVVESTTTAADVDGWDSLSHIRMILAVEQGFGVRFSAAQVSSLANVGELVDLIAAKTGAAARPAELLGKGA